MKYKHFILIVLMPFLMALSCQKREFGENSIFYYLNGAPTIPTCSYYPGSEVNLNGNDLNLRICGKPVITYHIKNYTGKGRYIVNTGNLNTCSVSYGYDHEYDKPVDDKTYLYVLELDTIQRHFEAVFEAKLQNNFQETVKITKGRMDINY